VLFRLALPAAALSLLLALASTPRALAQSEADLKTMDKVRALYLTGPIPSSISCDVAVDWDAFFKELKVEQTDEVKARLQKFKAIQMHVVSRDATHTDVTITGADPSISTVSDGLRQQLGGFFQTYRSLGFAQFLGEKSKPFQLTSNTNGYEVTSGSEDSKSAVEIDKAFLVTQFSFVSPQMNAVMKPKFQAGSNGLLRLSSIDETIDMGATKMVVNFGWDYQKIDGYDIPQHLHIALPGSFAFDYTLTGCKVTAEASPVHPAK
jgi:hypothetical protein